VDQRQPSQKASHPKVALDRAKPKPPAFWGNLNARRPCADLLEAAQKQPPCGGRVDRLTGERGRYIRVFLNRIYQLSEKGLTLMSCTWFERYLSDNKQYSAVDQFRARSDIDLGIYGLALKKTN
jgi:hypothetical protein